MVNNDTQSKFRNMGSSEFKQWFVGFVDGEGSFIITISKSGVIGFRFQIGLHIDDKDTLMLVRDRLNCGIVYEQENNNIAFLYVTKINDLKSILIPLLEEFPLNGIKYLDYLAFKKAIDTKYDESLSQGDKLKVIAELIDSINSKRENFEMPESHTIKITPY